MRNAMKEKHEFLSAYSPNGGFIAFVWSDASGKATARPVTLRDVKKFMSLKLASHYVEKGYRIVQLSCHSDPVLAPPVKRLDDSTLEVNGEALTYAIYKQHDGEVGDHELTLICERDGVTYEVWHASTRAQALVFLNYETELTEQDKGL